MNKTVNDWIVVKCPYIGNDATVFAISISEKRKMKQKIFILLLDPLSSFLTISTTPTFHDPNFVFYGFNSKTLCFMSDYFSRLITLPILKWKFYSASIETITRNRLLYMLRGGDQKWSRRWNGMALRECNGGRCGGQICMEMENRREDGIVITVFVHAGHEIKIWAYGPMAPNSKEPCRSQGIFQQKFLSSTRQLNMPPC